MTSYSGSVNSDVPASGRQLKFLLDLARQKGVSPQQIAGRFNVADIQQLTRNQCSKIIDEWRAANDRNAERFESTASLVVFSFQYLSEHLQLAVLLPLCGTGRPRKEFGLLLEEGSASVIVAWTGDRLFLRLQQG